MNGRSNWLVIAAFGLVAAVVGSALLPAPVARRGEERNFLRAAAATTAAGCLVIGGEVAAGIADAVGIFPDDQMGLDWK